MIAYDLVCKAGQHRFEGWFGSSADFDAQKDSGLLLCPVCGDHQVEKAIMAPNVGRKGNQIVSDRKPSDAGQEVALANMAELPTEMMEAIQKVAELQSRMLEKSEWVGDRFADEARAMHYGEAPDRIIHGQASIDDARELHEEGIAVAPLPLPFVPPTAKN